jgi:hypothetical protein
MRRAVLVALLAALALAAPGPVRAQGPDLAAMALTQADVPQGLRPNAAQTGPRGQDGIRGHQATFEGDPMAVASGGGGIVSVVNLVTLPPDPVAGLDDFVQGTKMGLPGSATDLAPPPVGDEGRAFTAALGLGPFSVSIAGTAFRRNAVVAGIIVMSAGAQPPSDVALRLAQIVDDRVKAATGG